MPGVEEAGPGWYRRSLSDGTVIELRGAPPELLWTGDGEPARAACERMLGFDPREGAAALAADPALAPLVRAAPGLRVPGHPDGAELALRAVLGQQVSVAAARTLAGRLVARLGEPLPEPVGGVTHRFPTPARIAVAPDDLLAMPAARRRAVRALAAALADGMPLERAELLALPGIGPWTAEYVALRALGDADAFPLTDLGVRQAARRLGLPDDPRGLRERAQRWRPWRGLATIHLWHSLAA